MEDMIRRLGSADKRKHDECRERTLENPVVFQARLLGLLVGLNKFIFPGLNFGVTRRLSSLLGHTESSAQWETTRNLCIVKNVMYFMC